MSWSPFTLQLSFSTHFLYPHYQNQSCKFISDFHIVKFIGCFSAPTFLDLLEALDTDECFHPFILTFMTLTY